jgi:hypothetical protein
MNRHATALAHSRSRYGALGKVRALSSSSLAIAVVPPASLGGVPSTAMKAALL